MPERDRRIRLIAIDRVAGALRDSRCFSLVAATDCILHQELPSIGFIGAFGLTRVMASLLFSVRPDDPATYLAISLLLGAVAFLACYLPARRAAKLDPLIALSRT